MFCALTAFMILNCLNNQDCQEGDKGGNFRGGRQGLTFLANCLKV